MLKMDLPVYLPAAATAASISNDYNLRCKSRHGESSEKSLSSSLRDHFEDAMSRQRAAYY